MPAAKSACAASTLERERNPKGFWIGIGFEIVMLFALAFGIASGLAL